MSRIEIDPAGDVLLLISTLPTPSPNTVEPNQDGSIGDYPNKESLISTESGADNETADHTQELLVSSKVLSVASPVFKAMFYGKFTEGVALAAATDTPNKSPYQLPLPDDDAEAMTLLCRIIHFKVDGVADRPSTETLERLAIVCDKYDCTTTLRFSGGVWVRNWLLYYDKVAPRISNLCYLLVFAYVADLHFEFTQIAWKLLLYHKGPLTGRDSQASILANHPLLHEDVREYLDIKRAIFCEEFHKAAMEPLTAWTWGSLTRGCFRAARATAEYTEGLRNRNLFPYDLNFSKHRFLEILGLAERLESITPARCITRDRGGGQCACLLDQCENLNAPVQRTIKLIRNKKAWYGCLDCLTDEDTDRDGESCRIGHESSAFGGKSK